MSRRLERVAFFDGLGPGDHVLATVPVGQKWELRSWYFTIGSLTTDLQVYVLNPGPFIFAELFFAVAPPTKSTIAQPSTWVVMNAGDELHADIVGAAADVHGIVTAIIVA